MTEHGSASAMSELEPSVAPAPVASQHGDIDMAELGPSGSQPCDEPTHKEYTNLEPTGNEETSDQLSGNQPSGNQSSGDQPTDAQPMGDQSIDDQPMGDQSMGQPTDTQRTEATISEVSLIAEIQKCPYIFHGDYKVYYEQEAMRREWDNICEGLFPQWSTFSPNKKKDLCRKVQNKWAKIREPFFKSYGRTKRRPTHVRNVEHSAFDFFNALTFATAFNMSELGKNHLDGLGARNHQEENARKGQNANYSHEEYARKEQNTSREGEHVHVMNPIPKKIPLAEFPEIFKQPVPSTSSVINENQGDIPENLTVTVPTKYAQLNKNRGHISVNPMASVPSTSAENNQRQNDFQVLLPPINQQNKAGFHNMPQLNPAHYTHMRFVPLPTDAENFPTANDLVMPSMPPCADDQSTTCASLCATLKNLDYDQQCAVWPNLMNLLSNASKSKPKKIKILQGELLNPGGSFTQMPATGPEIILQVPCAGPELEISAREQFADPELGIQQTSTEKRVDQETMAVLKEKECIYPPSHGRPTNAQGEIIYPETDDEDLDED